MEPAISIEEVRRFVRDVDARWIDPRVKATHVGENPATFRPRRMLSVGGLVLIEDDDQPGTWWMGQDREGIVETWSNYGALPEAIARL